MTQVKVSREICRVKQAVKAFIRQNPDGLTHEQICLQLMKGSLFHGTYRNLRSMTSSVLELLVREGSVMPGDCHPNTFIPTHSEMGSTGEIERMNWFAKVDSGKCHTRSIEMSTYDYDPQRLVIKGCLTDHRFREFQMATGETKSPGILHQMIIRLLVNKSTLQIEDLHVEMPVVPGEDCLEAVNSLDSVRGLRIAGGFTAKVKALAGGGKGCQHLVALLTAMGPSTVQGYAAYNDHNSPGFILGKINMLEDTCWAWRSEGPLLNLLKKIKADKEADNVSKNAGTLR